MNDKINERLETEQTWLLDGKERFHDLMKGETVFKRESEHNAKVAKAQQLQLQKEEVAAAKKAEKSKKKIFKNPLKISPRHGSKQS